MWLVRLHWYFAIPTSGHAAWIARGESKLDVAIVVITIVFQHNVGDVLICLGIWMKMWWYRMLIATAQMRKHPLVFCNQQERSMIRTYHADRMGLYRHYWIFHWEGMTLITIHKTDNLQLLIMLRWTSTYQLNFFHAIINVSVLIHNLWS